uniref:Glutathione peroxidase 7 n=1 Tax=Sphaerodactylus townsendi TaxID=933632 RepID=A0ACB8F3V1_9SAUR
MLDPEDSAEHKVGSSFPKPFLVFVAMLIVLGAWLLLAFSAFEQKETDFYSFKVVNIRGKLVSLEKYRGATFLEEESVKCLQCTLDGKLSSRISQFDVTVVSLVVNVASECGYTDSHYKVLQQLQRELGPYHFNVLAFPCNQFGQQEPDSNKEIESFARKTYGVSFPMFSKVAVTGTGANPAFKYLVESTGEEPTWNFWKYLVNPSGKVVKVWDSTVAVEEIKPYVTELIRDIIRKKKDEL